MGFVISRSVAMRNRYGLPKFMGLTRGLRYRDFSLRSNGNSTG